MNQEYHYKRNIKTEQEYWKIINDRQITAALKTIKTEIQRLKDELKEKEAQLKFFTAA